MRASTHLALVASLLLTSQAQLIPFLTEPSIWSAAESHDGMAKPENQQQQRLDSQTPGIQLPPGSPFPGDNGRDDNDNDNNPNPAAPPGGSALILSDVLGTQRSVNIFAGFTRQIDTVSQRLEDGGRNTTVLAPRNGAVTALPRKPWEDAREYAALGAEAYAGDGGEQRAQANLRRFTEAHVVPASPWAEGERVESMGGGTLWWERKDGVTRIQPGDVEVESVASRVANGEVWVIKDVLNYAS